MAVVVIGWGSLIWHPGELRLRSRWHLDGPALPVEYARISQNGRATLVIHPDAPDQITLWAEWDGTDVEAARRDLQAREGCPLARIHCLCRGGAVYGDVPAIIVEQMNRWLAAKDMDAVVWTGLESNWQEERSAQFSADEVISYLRSLQRGDGPTLDLAREYIQKHWCPN